MSGGCKERSDKMGKSAFACPRSKRDKNKTSESACTEKPVVMCKDAFGRKPCPPPKQEEEKVIECHESLKNFLGNNKKKTSHDKKVHESHWKEVKGGTKCDHTTTKTDKTFNCKDSSKNACSCSSAKPSDQAGCKKTDASSKNSWFCKHIEKKCAKPSLKPERPLRNNVVLNLPEMKIMALKPCLPQVEKSISANQRKLCAFPVENFCPKLKKPRMADFFCIDARNVKMNECVKQYLNTDAGRCSHLLGMHTAMETSLESSPSRAGFLPPKYRQIFGRWLPTAGAYAVATFALAVWVTEWGAVVKHLPFHKVEEEPVAPPKTPTETPPTELESDDS